jgi:hypothetical protein
MVPDAGFLDGVEPRPPRRVGVGSGRAHARALGRHDPQRPALSRSNYLGSRIEALLEERHGLRARYRGHAELGVPSRGRRYLRYDFVCREASGRRPWLSFLSRARRRSFFVKQGRRIGNPALEQFLTDNKSFGFRTPIFYGKMGGRDHTVLLWEFVEGDHPNLPIGSVQAVVPIIELVAAINSVPDDLVRTVKPLRVQTPWIAPVAEETEGFLRACTAASSSGQVLRLLEAFARCECRIIGRFADLGDRFFTHHDVKRENLLCPPGESGLTVLDWTSAALSVPGTGLRFLSRWDAPSRAVLADHYIRCMARSGHRLRLEDVLFALEGHAVFKTLRKGVASGDAKVVRAGLALFARFRERLSAHAHWLFVAGAAC